MDFGAKRNILRLKTVVPTTASAKTCCVRTSGRPGGDRHRAGVPMICLGHDPLGAGTKKMHLGHRGANHPVKDLIRVDECPTDHVSLFDEKAFAVPVALSSGPVPPTSPGPQDSHGRF